MLKTQKLFGIIIIVMMYVTLTPYSQYYSINLFARIIAVILLGIGLICGCFRLKNMDLILTANIIFIPTLFILIQFLVVQNQNSLSYWGGRCLAFFCAVYIYRSVGFSLFLNTLKWIMLLDIIGTLIWLVLGSVQPSDIPGYNYLISYKSITQSVYIVGDGMFSNRFCGFSTNPNVFGFISACGMLSLLWEKKISHKIGWLFIFLIGTMMHQSRAAILFVLLFYFIYYSTASQYMIRRIILMILVLFIGVISLLALSETRGASSIDGGRLLGNLVLIDLYFSGSITEMLFGIGYGGLRDSILKNSFWIMTDNSYTPLLLENGVIGVCFLLTPCIVPIIYAVRKNKIMLKKWLPFVVSFFIYSMLENTIYGIAQSYLWTLWILYLLDEKVVETE